jgi:cell division protein FtsB
VAATFGSCAVGLNSWYTVGQLEKAVAHLEKQNADLKTEVKELRQEDRRFWDEITGLWKGADAITRELPRQPD